MTDTLPLVGIASRISRLPEYIDWLLEGQRPLELQDPFFGLERFDDGAPDLVREAKEYLQGYSGHLGMHGPFVSMQLAAGDGRIRQVVADRYVAALTFGAELGVRYMVVHSPLRIFGHALVQHTDRDRLARTINAVHATLERPLALARQVGCEIVIETIADTNPEPLKALVSSFDDGVGLSIDIGHNIVTEQFGGPPPHEWVNAAGALLKHMHLQDGDGMVDRHWLPGQGCLNWWALFNALRQSSADPVLIVEVRDALAGANWLIERGFVR